MNCLLLTVYRLLLGSLADHPLPVVLKTVGRQAHEYAGHKAYGVLEGPGDICPDLPPEPPSCFVLQMIEFMKGHKLFDTAWQVLSNIGYLSGRLSITISRIKFLPGEIDNLWHLVHSRARKRNPPNPPLGKGGNL